MEETAYFLDLTLNVSFQSCITGAMRSSNEIGSDGVYNLMSAIRVAAADAKEKGVLVVLNDEIHTAENVTKTHTSNVTTFKVHNMGLLDIVTKSKFIFIIHHNQRILAVQTD